MSAILSLTGRRWLLKRQQPAGDDLIDQLRRERGINDSVDQKLSDPFLFAEMNIAVQRIEAALKNKETLAIFGDYDADGITGTAQLVRYFRRHGLEPLVHLPDRVKEGYGMKKESIDRLKEKGATLLITVDTGISAHAEIAYATALGIDVIVTDHHRVQGGRPDAFAVIHPQVPSEFPNQHLSGSGVAFMLIRALEKLEPWDGIDLDIALATIGTVGDLVPLTGENRILVTHGIRFLQKLPPSPLKDFVDSVRSDGPLTATDLAFRIVPRINAAGRMAHPLVALEALLEGGKALEELHRLNGDRRSLVDDLYADLGTSIPKTDGFLVVWSETITPGTAGLIASRLSEQFGRPSLVAAVLGDMAVASVRSIPQIDVMDILSDPSVQKILKTFGGHAQAAGCTFAVKDADMLRIALNQALLQRGFTTDQMLPTLELDAEILHRHVTVDTGRTLASLAPFGSGNDEPLFLLPKQTLTSIRTVGADGSHLQATVNGVRSIGFRLGALIEHLTEDTPVDLACKIGINSWNGRESVQLVIEDIRNSGQ